MSRESLPDDLRAAPKGDVVAGHGEGHPRRLLVRAGIDEGPAVAAADVSPRGLLVVSLDDALLEAPSEDALQFREVVVVVSSWAILRRSLVATSGLGTTRRLVVVVTSLARRPHPSLGGSPTLGVREFRWEQQPREGSSQLRCRLHVARPASVHTLLTAVLGDARRTTHGAGALGLRVGLVGRAGEEWVAGDPLARYVDRAFLDGQPDDDIPAVDLILTDEGRPHTREPERPRKRWIPVFRLESVSEGRTIKGPSWEALALDVGFASTWPGKPERRALLLPPVDILECNPKGFLNVDVVGSGVVRESSGGAEIRTVIVNDDGDRVLDIRPGQRIGREALDALRTLRHIEDRPHAHPGPVEHARFLVQLAAAGVPLSARQLPVAVQWLVGKEVASELTSIEPTELEDPLQREAHSIRLRRSALRHHSPAARLCSLVGRHFILGSPTPTVSVLLATNRPTFLAQAVQQVAQQRYPRIQLVLALHGNHFSQSLIEQSLEACPWPTEVVRVGGDRTLGEVLNEATRRCSGTYVTKMDDDDWYGPEHIWDLMLASQYSQASLVGKAAEFVYLDDLDLTIRRQGQGTERYSEHVAGSTLFMARNDLDEIGGWRPVSRAVDRSLLQTVAALGGSIYRTHGHGYLIHRHGSAHTWDVESGYFLRSSREQWRGWHGAEFGMTMPPTG